MECAVCGYFGGFVEIGGVGSMPRKFAFTASGDRGRRRGFPEEVVNGCHCSDFLVRFGSTVVVSMGSARSGGSDKPGA